MASREEIATSGVAIAFANEELAIRFSPTGKGDDEFVAPTAVGLSKIISYPVVQSKTKGKKMK